MYFYKNLIDRFHRFPYITHYTMSYLKQTTETQVISLKNKENKSRQGVVYKSL